MLILKVSLFQKKECRSSFNLNLTEDRATLSTDNVLKSLMQHLAASKVCRVNITWFFMWNNIPFYCI